MYYPLSKIIENQYTNGDEYVELKTSVPYKGYYYSTVDGKFFTGKTYSYTAKELIKLKTTSSVLLVDVPKYFVPAPSEADYIKGYIDRYAIKRVNSGPETIREVSKEDYDRTISNPLYIQRAFRWVITGSMFDDMSIPGYPIHGIITKNLNTVTDLENFIPGASNFFSNYAQYAR